MGVLFFNQTFSAVLGGVDRVRYYFISGLGIMLIEEANAGDYISCARFVDSHARTLDENFAIRGTGIILRERVGVLIYKRKNGIARRVIGLL